jgi:flagellin
MVSGVALNTTAFRVASFYQSSGTFLQSALQKIASGKRMQQPKDNIADFFRSQKLKQDSAGYARVSGDLQEGIATLQVAEKSGAMVFDDLTRMRELVDYYWDDATSRDERSAINAEFQMLADHVSSTIDSAYYNDKQLIQSAGPLARIMLDPNSHQTTFDIEFDAANIADASALDIAAPDQSTAAARVQAELDKAGRYLGQVSGYINSLWSQVNLAQNQIRNYKNLDSQISDTDQAREVSVALNLQIRRQASLSMLSQANTASQSVLALFR